MERRELLKVLANVGLISLVTACSELIPDPKSASTLKQSVQAGTLDQLAQNGKYILTSVATAQSPSYPVAVMAVAATSAPNGAIPHPAVAGLYLVAFSRVCTHQGTTCDAPANGLMHCSNHGQDYDLKTGNPTGLAQKTNTPLSQLSLEIRNGNQVWITGFGAGSPIPSPTPTPTPAPTGNLTLNTPAKVASLSQLQQDGTFLVTTLATNQQANHPVIVVAASSASALSGAVAHPSVAGLYLLAFSRTCTHQGTTINTPVNGRMNCSNHNQDYDYKTGNPVGNANKTSVPLAQFSLEVRGADLWAVGVLRDGGSNTPVPTPTPTGTLTLSAATKLATLSQVGQTGQFVVGSAATNLSASYPVIVVAASSSSALSGGLAHPTVPNLYILAFSRVCTHQGTTINNPSGGIMHCSNHGQDFDTKTGNPTGTANKSTVPLAQFGLELRGSEVWAVSVVRDGGGAGGGGGDDD